jgi:hypothetical protein
MRKAPGAWPFMPPPRPTLPTRLRRGPGPSRLRFLRCFGRRSPTHRRNARSMPNRDKARKFAIVRQLIREALFPR